MTRMLCFIMLLTVMIIGVEASPMTLTIEENYVKVFNGDGKVVFWIREDGYVFSEGQLSIGEDQVVNPYRELYVNSIVTDPASYPTGAVAIGARMNYKPTVGTDQNPDGVYGVLWYNSPVHYTGSGAAVRANTYTIQQTNEAAVDVDRLIALYGRARHEAKGNINFAMSLYADGAQVGPNGGQINNAVGVYFSPITAAQNNYGLYFASAPTDGTVYAAHGDVKIVSSNGFGIQLKTGDKSVSIDAEGRYRSYNSGNLIGVANGNINTPNSDTTNILFYDNSSSNWGGLGADTQGNIFIASGTNQATTKLSIQADTGQIRLHSYTPGILYIDENGYIQSSSLSIENLLQELYP